MKASLVLTRPAQQSMRFGEALSAALGDQADVVISPLLHIKGLDFGPVSRNHDLIFTSENGVAGFVAGADVGNRKAFCVGDRTAEAAREAGFEAFSASGTSTDLIELISEEGGGEMIYARGAHIARDLRKDLAAVGIPVTEALVYAQDPLALSDEVRELVRGAKRLVFPLFSRRSMELLVGQGISGGTASMSAVCISKAVAAAAPPECFGEVIVCDAPNSGAMIAKLQTVIA